MSVGPRGIATENRKHHTGRATQVVAVVLLLAGMAVAAYTAWTPWFTGLSAERAQEELRRRWAADVGAVPTALPSVPLSPTDSLATAEDDSTPAGGRAPAGSARTAPSTNPAADTAGDEPRGAAARSEPARPATPPDDNPAPRVSTGDPYAFMWFSRPDGPEPPVHAEPLYVVQGVGRDELRTGPGHYPHSDAPGGSGNFAVAGHRTTYGAPFGRLDELMAGDLIHVADHSGRWWTYEVVRQRIVDPGDAWVLTADPLRTGIATMTLTTCHPKWSGARRLVVFAELSTTPQ